MQVVLDSAARSAAPVSQDADEIWLSILIPVYNVESHVLECLRSIFAQMTEGVEVVLLDDRSTDDSKALCERYRAAAGSRFRVIAHQENRGVGAARNSLLAAAAGEYVWYVDADDAMLPGSIHDLRAVVRRHAPDIVLCDYVWKNRRRSSFDGKSGLLQHDRADLVRGVFANRRLHLWSKIVRRALWGDDLRFPDVRCFEDVAVTPLLLLRAKSHYYLRRPCVFYRVRPRSLIGLVSRTVGAFDKEKNDDLARALSGYVAVLRRSVPDVDDGTLLEIGHFCAKEFTKISARLIAAGVADRDWIALRRSISRYRAMLEGCSPCLFGALMKAYLRRFQFDRWIVLGLFLLIAGPLRPAPASGPMQADLVGRNHDDEAEDHGQRRGGDAEIAQQQK